MKFYMEKSLNELKKNFKREYANMTSTKDTVDILEFYRNDNNQLREQVKDRHEILNGIVKVLQNLHQNKQNQSSMTAPNLSVNIDKSIAMENSSEKSHDIKIDFSVNKSFSTPSCLHVEAPLNFPIINDLNKTKLNDIKKHLVAATYQKNVTAIEMEQLNSTPAKNITEETTAESFYNAFDKEDQNAATEALKEKVTNQTSEMQNGEKEEVNQRAKKSKGTVFIVGDCMIKKFDGYLLTNSINHKFLVKVRPFTIAKTINM